MILICCELNCSRLGSFKCARDLHLLQPRGCFSCSLFAQPLWPLIYGYKSSGLLCFPSNLLHGTFRMPPQAYVYHCSSPITIMSSPYDAAPLDLAKNEIRLIRLKSVSNSDAIESTLRSYSLNDQNLSYIALSYCWCSKERYEKLVLKKFRILLVEAFGHSSIRHGDKHRSWLEKSDVSTQRRKQPCKTIDTSV